LYRPPRAGHCPDLDGTILFLEAVDLYLGQIDRQLTMLRKGGYLSDMAGNR
jgi:muramoyltetrapeptide carboxypeptidase